MNDKEKKAIETLKEIQESNRSWLKETNEQSCEKIYLRDIEAIETVLKLIEKQQYIIEGKECVIETQAHNEEVLNKIIDEKQAGIEDLKLKIQTQKELLKMKTREIEKKDKIIEEMAIYLADIDFDECCAEIPEPCLSCSWEDYEPHTNCIKEYFENKVKEKK